MKTPAPVYGRAPSPELLALLEPGGLLAPLVELTGREDGVPYHDVHFRMNDEVHVYRGHARLIVAKGLGNGRVNLKAHYTYTSQPGATGFFRQWQVDETGFATALHHYLSTVEVRETHTTGEALVQEQWAKVREPWIPFDREGALQGNGAKGAGFPSVMEAKNELNFLAGDNDWPLPKSTGMFIDQLAIDPEGRLVLLELKDASKANAEVYYSPFQLLQYVWEWQGAMQGVRNSLQAIIDSRVTIGLAPPNVPPLSGEIRASVGFGPDRRSSRVKRRYEMVLQVVNRYLPEGVAPLEIWALADSGPILVA